MGAEARTVLSLYVGVGAAAAVFVDGRLRAAVREEVVARRPSAAGFPAAAVDALLEFAAIAPGDVTEVVATGLGPPAGPLAGLRRVVSALRGARPQPVAGTARVRAAAGQHPAFTEADLQRGLAAARLGGARLALLPVTEARSALASAAVSAEQAVALGAEDPPPSALAVGAAWVLERELKLPSDSTLWAPGFGERAAYRALGNAALPQQDFRTACERARVALHAGRSVAWARGPAAFLDLPFGPRAVLSPPSLPPPRGAGGRWRRGGTGARPDSELTMVVRPESADPRWAGPSFDVPFEARLLTLGGIAALTPVDVVRAFRESGADELILGV